MLSILEWFCSQYMEAEVDQQLGAEKVNAQTEEAATAADIAANDWIPEWERCT